MRKNSTHISQFQLRFWREHTGFSQKISRAFPFSLTEGKKHSQWDVAEEHKRKKIDRNWWWVSVGGGFFSVKSSLLTQSHGLNSTSPICPLTPPQSSVRNIKEGWQSCVEWGEKREKKKKLTVSFSPNITSKRGNHVYEKRAESLFKYEKGIAQFFPSFFFHTFFFVWYTLGVGERVSRSREWVYEAGECTHPYKRKIESERRKRVKGGNSKRANIYQKAERTTGFGRYIIRIDILRFFIIKYIEGAKFLFWSVKSWCLQSKHRVEFRALLIECSSWLW